MNEVNESDSGSALESVVQSRTDSDGASNPTVQSAATELEAIREMTWKTFVVINDSDNLPSEIYGDLRVMAIEMHDKVCKALKRMRKLPLAQHEDTKSST